MTMNTNIIRTTNPTMTGKRKEKKASLSADEEMDLANKRREYSSSEKSMIENWLKKHKPKKQTHSTAS